MIQRILASFVGLAWIAACSPAEEAADAEEAATVTVASDQPALQPDMLVRVEWLAERLGNDDIVVVHVGNDASAYAAGHIPGARFLPITKITEEIEGIPNELPSVAQLTSVFEAIGVSDDSRVIVYGAPLHAARTFFTLDYLGHGDRTALLDGGLQRWEAAGQPLSTAAPTFAPGTFTPRPRPETVVDAAWVRDHLGDSAVALVDARPPAQFTGAEPGDGIPRPGHIPGAVNIFWEEMLRAMDVPLLEDEVALRSMFGAAGVEPGDTVVVYCRTGMQSSFAYYVARYLGYETRMYDASFIDWSQLSEMPVER